MIQHDLSNWQDLDNLKGLLFFAQRLEELTYPYSLDSYKSPTMSTPGLVLEAINVLRTIGKERSAEHATKICGHIVDELKMRMKGNWVAKSVCVSNVQETLDFNLDEKNFNEFLHKLNVLKAELDIEHYLSEIVDCVINFSSTPAKKSTLEFLAVEMVSLLQHKGVSREHMHACVTDFFWSDQQIAKPEQIKEFMKLIFPHLHKFHVILGVSGAIVSIDKDFLVNLGISIEKNVKKSKNGKSEELLKSFRDESGHEWVCFVDCMAPDYTSAAVNAVNKLGHAFSFYALFNHKENLQISEKAWVIQKCCGNDLKELIPHKNNMKFARDNAPLQARAKLKRYSADSSLHRAADSNKFWNILNMHAMSVSSVNPDIQIMNLWTCLETICPDRIGGSKIENVAAQISPIICLQYFDNIVTYLLMDILRFNKMALSSSLKLCKNLPDGDLKEKFIAFLTRSENGDARTFFYESCGNFELLKFRTYQIHDLMSNVSKSYDRLERHEKLVKWQIHRIYRARNEIVHAGMRSDNVQYMVENAHDYFDQALNFCLSVSAWKSGFSRFTQCFDFGIRQFEIYKSNMKNGKLDTAVWALPKLKDRSYIFSDGE